MSGSFADSNILIYLASEIGWKADIAESIVAQRPVVSVQVLNETANVLVNKLKRPWAETSTFLLSVRTQVEIVALDERTHDIGVGLAMRHSIHIYDSMIVAAALLSGCSTLYSEDMQHGMVIDGRLRIVNPFAT